MSLDDLRSIYNKKIDELTHYELALAFHKTHRNEHLTFKNAHYLKAIYQDKNPYIVLKKATQSGISEYLISRAIDRARKKKNILYVLPTDTLKSQFVKDRFDKTVVNTPFYRQLIKETPIKHNDSMALKQISDGTIAFVFSNSTVAFVSFPADDVIIDELDECNQDNITMAEERQSASKDKTTIKVSNPKFVGFGIDVEFKNSDRKEWFLKHDCGEWINPDFFKHIISVVDGVSYILDTEWDKVSLPGPMPICPKCHKPYDRYSTGEWVSNYNHSHSGYHINKMFSTTVTTYEMLDRYIQGLTNNTIMQRVYNGDHGLAYTASGAKINDIDIFDCITEYTMPDKSEAVCVMGVDVGSLLHVRINQLLPDNKKRAVYIDTVRDEIEIVDLWQKYNCKFGVIDAMPETRLSKKLCATLKGMAMCMFQESAINPRVTHDKVIHINRTQFLDSVKEMILKKEIELPLNTKSIKDYVEQLTSSTRVYDEDKDKYNWIESGPDHYLFAEGYCLLAERLIKML